MNSTLPFSKLPIHLMAFLAFSSRALDVEVCLIEGGAMFNRFFKDAKRSSADIILKVMHSFLNFPKAELLQLKFIHLFASQLLPMKKLEIEKTKPTFIISVLKVE